MSVSSVGSSLPNLQFASQVQALRQKASEKADPSFKKGEADALNRPGYPKMTEGILGQMLERLQRDRRGMIAESRSISNISDANKALKALDADSNGVVFKNELTSRLQGNNTNIQAQNFGRILLNSYDGVSALDGQDGISSNDVTKLAGLAKADGNSGAISGLDFMAANNMANYNSFISSYQNMEAQFGALLDAKLVAEGSEHVYA